MGEGGRRSFPGIELFLVVLVGLAGFRAIGFPFFVFASGGGELTHPPPSIADGSENGLAVRGFARPVGAARGGSDLGDVVSHLGEDKRERGEFQNNAKWETNLLKVRTAACCTGRI